jgi:hypothetical protein
MTSESIKAYILQYCPTFRDQCKHLITYDATNLSISGLQGPKIVKNALVNTMSLSSNCLAADIYQLKSKIS